MPITLKITGEYSHVARNVLTNTSWPANLCEYIGLAATNVFEIRFCSCPYEHNLLTRRDPDPGGPGSRRVSNGLTNIRRATKVFGRKLRGHVSFVLGLVILRQPPPVRKCMSSH